MRRALLLFVFLALGIAGAAASGVKPHAGPVKCNPGHPENCPPPTTTTTGTTTTTPPPSGYPASFFTGPAGQNIVLPQLGHIFLGTHAGSDLLSEQVSRTEAQEGFIGKPYSLFGIHYSAPAPGTGGVNGCYYNGLSDYIPVASGKENYALAHGKVAYVSWSPAWYANEISSGLADACLRDVASRYAAYDRPILLRMYWESFGTWFRWSKNSDGTLATDAQLKTEWQHTVDVMRSTGISKVSFAWCPGHDGAFSHVLANAYPGDSYVDWVCEDAYNHNSNGAWCAAWPGWSPTIKGYEDWWCDPAVMGKAMTNESSFRGQKPFLLGETGSVEDIDASPTPGRKGQWMLGWRDYIDGGNMPNLLAVSYFDYDFTGSGDCNCNWQVDSTQSSYDGFKQLALDPVFGG